MLFRLQKLLKFVMAEIYVMAGYEFLFQKISFREHKNFNFIEPKHSYASGHFIQLIWKPTYKLGVGIAYAHDQTWVVARYTPSEQALPGDIHDHVKSPKGSIV